MRVAAVREQHLNGDQVAPHLLYHVANQAGGSHHLQGRRFRGGRGSSSAGSQPARQQSGEQRPKQARIWVLVFQIKYRNSCTPALWGSAHGYPLLLKMVFNFIITPDHPMSRDGWGLLHSLSLLKGACLSTPGSSKSRARWQYDPLPEPVAASPTSPTGLIKKGLSSAWTAPRVHPCETYVRLMAWVWSRQWVWRLPPARCPVQALLLAAWLAPALPG